MSGAARPAAPAPAPRKPAAKPRTGKRRARTAQVAPPVRRPAALLRRAAEMAGRIVTHHFGSPPRSLEHEAAGMTNLVFRVDHVEGEFVVRICPDATRLGAFIKEQWAMRAARGAGVPVPEVLEVASDIVPHAYMVARKVEGRSATTHPERLAILDELGSYARRINAIRTRGFGSTFDWTENRLSRCETWAQYLSGELDVGGCIAALERERMIDRSQARHAQRSLKALSALDGRPTLCHGDLRLKNVIVDDAGRIRAIIDWESATSSLAPYWELTQALHDCSVDEKQAFLDGYGIAERRIVEIAPMLRVLNLVEYASQVRKVLEAGDRRRLEQYRTRLSGALDAYSFR